MMDPFRKMYLLKCKSKMNNIYTNERRKFQNYFEDITNVQCVNRLLHGKLLNYSQTHPTISYAAQ